MLTVPVSFDYVNLVWSTDWHLSALPPGRRADDYQAAILAKLEFIRMITNKVQGVALCGGDVFHLKNSRHPANSIPFLVNVAKALKCFPTGKVYGAVGNHDLGWGERMDSLLSQPLGLMVASEVYHNLSDTPIMVHNGHLKVAVHVESFPYSRADEMLPRILASRRDPDANYHVGIVHAYGNPGESKEYFGEPTIGYDDLAGADFDYLLWGHDHGREETVKVGNVTHVRLGSLARAALDTDEQERPVSLAVLSFRQDGVKYKEVPVPVKPLEEAFVVADQGVRKVEKSEEMKEFFTKMEEAVEGVETSDPAEALRLLCSDDPKLLALAKELCGL